MNCLVCRKEIADSSRFCCYCGARQAPGVAGQRLMRAILDKKIAGVCGGFADYFAVDPTVMRIIWAFITLATGIVPGIAAYRVAWFLMPQAPFIAAPGGATQTPTPGQQAQ